MAIPLPTGLRAAYRAERAASRPSSPRASLLTRVGRGIGRLANHAEKLRQAALSLGGLACLDYAAFRWDEIAGWAAIGVSLLVVEWLTSDSGDA